MSLYGLAMFAGIYAMAAGIPGPSVVALMGRALASGARRTAPLIWGMVIGDLAWFAFAAFGLAALAQTLHGLFVVIKYAGAAYLLFMAWKLWTAPAVEARAGEMQRDGKALRLMATGLSLTLGNPKIMVFFLAILPHVLDLGALTSATFLELAACMAVVELAVMWTYALLADRARRLIRNANRMRVVNRGSALVMAGAAGAVTMG